MSTVSGKVLYFGKDTEFSEPMERFFLERSKEILTQTELYSKGIIVEKCTTTKVDVIFVDFSEDTLDLNSIISETLYLKRIHQLKSILLVAIFKNEMQKDEHVHIFTSGFQLSYIKGTDTVTVFIDSFYIGFRQKIDFPVLAQAYNINKDLRAGICSTITGMNNSGFSVETDIDGVEDLLSLHLPMFPDLKCDNFEIKNNSTPPDFYPMTSSYKLIYPFSGPWGEDTEATIQVDTVETWLDNYKEEFESILKLRVKVFSSDITIMNDLFKSCGESILIDCGDEIQELEGDTSSNRPSLIFLNLDDDRNGKVSLSSLYSLLSSNFLESDYNPIIVVGNCPSTGEALQKAYLYPMIVATRPKLDSKLFMTLVSKFQSKKQETLMHPIQHFKTSSIYRQIDVFQTLMISSLTEHEITFYSEAELPMFTILHFTLPIEFHATLVPPIHELPNKGNKKHYMAFIHGLSEEQLMTLRKFVNQVIHVPLVDFSPENIKKMREVAPIVKPAEVVKVKPELSSVPKIKQTIDYKKYSISGKSKL